jgi:multidrug resistance efflux pump
MKKSKFIKYFFIFFILISLASLRYYYVKNISKKIFGEIKFFNLDILSNQKGQIDKVYVKNNDYVRKNDILFEYKKDRLEAKKNIFLAKLNLLNEKKNLIKYSEKNIMDEYLNIKKENTLPVEIKNKLNELEKKQLELNILLAKENELKEKINLLDIEIKNRYFRSPIDGKIENFNVFENQYVFFANKLLTIVDEKKIWIESKVSKKFLDKNKKNQRFEAFFLSKPNIKFEAVLNEISDDIISNKKNIKLIVLRDDLISQSEINFFKDSKVKLKRK